MAFSDLGILSDIFGKKPQVAKFKPLNLGTEQKASISGNIGAFPQISQLGDLYQSYLSNQMNEILPGFSDIMKTGASTTQEMLDAATPLLKGEIPQDVIDQIQRSDAYQALSGGYAGSQMGHNLTARDLGLTSLDLMGRGATLAGQGGNAAQRWASLAKGETLDPASMFTTPSQQSAFDLENRILQQQSQQFAYNVAAAPDPALAGISNTISSLVGAYLGATGFGGLGGGSKGGGGGFAQAGQTSIPFNAGTNLGAGMNLDWGSGFGYG